MPRNKRRCKNTATVKFSPSVTEVDGKGSYESRLREWRKARDNLETEARTQAEMLCKSIEQEIATLQREYLDSLKQLDPVLLDAPYEWFVECDGNPEVIMKRLKQSMESDMKRTKLQPLPDHRPPAPSKRSKKQKKVAACDTVTSAQDENSMPFVTPMVAKPTVSDMTATGVTGRQLKHGERTVLKYLYVSDTTGSPIVNPEYYRTGYTEKACDDIMQCLPKRYRQKLEAKMQEAGAKIITCLEEQNLAEVTPFHH